MSKKFDRLLEKATDPTLLEPDWAGILQCVDAIRGGDVNVRTAVASLQRRYHSENPHVAHHTLLVLEAAVKNCGEKLHKEIATKESMEDLKHLAMESKAETVKEKILELIQCWAHAFRGNQDFKIIVDTHNLMKLEGFEFPPARESDAMFSAESAPEWQEGDSCYRCRTAFGFITRKHHCRNCGQVFCDKCSAKQLLLPHLGIEREVRVCDTCFDKLAKSTDIDPEKKTKVVSEKTMEQNGETELNKTDSAKKKKRVFFKIARKTDESKVPPDVFSNSPDAPDSLSDWPSATGVMRSHLFKKVTVRMVRKLKTSQWGIGCFEDKRTNEVYVCSVSKLAVFSGLQICDLILSANRKRIKSIGELTAAVDKTNDLTVEVDRPTVFYLSLIKAVHSDARTVTMDGKTIDSFSDLRRTIAGHTKYNFKFAKNDAGASVSKNVSDSTDSVSILKKKKETESKQKEEEELQLAIAISQSEQEEKDRQRQLQLYHLYNGPDSGDEASSAVTNGATANNENRNSSFDYKGARDTTGAETAQNADVDPELARYLNRNYWDQRRKDQKQGILRQSPTPSAPPPSETTVNESPSRVEKVRSDSTSINQPQSDEQYAVQNGEIQTNGDQSENDSFSAALTNQVEVFVNRIRSNQARGRSVVNDSSIQTLFLTLTNLHANLLQRLQALDDKRAYYESLQDRLANIQEARQAIDALREEHERQKQLQLQEEQRRRQLAMQQKLDVMRQKKHEMLEEQRLLALHRFQQQQVEIQMRKQMAQAGYIMAGQMPPLPGQAPMMNMMSGQYGAPNTMVYPGVAGIPQQIPSGPISMPPYQPTQHNQQYDMQMMAQALPQQPLMSSGMYNANPQMSTAPQSLPPQMNTTNYQQPVQGMAGYGVGTQQTQPTLSQQQKQQMYHPTQTQQVYDPTQYQQVSANPQQQQQYPMVQPESQGQIQTANIPVAVAPAQIQQQEPKAEPDVGLLIQF